MTSPHPSRSLRQTAILLALVLVACVVALLGNAGSAAARRTKPEPASSALRVVTYNVSADVRVKRTVADLRSIIANQAPDVIALQEMSSWKRRQAVRKHFVDCEGCLYDTYMPIAAVPGGQPILFRRDKYTLLGSGMRQVTEVTYVGSRGAGPSTIHAKWITWVRLQDLATGRRAYVLNNHFVPTVQARDGGTNRFTRRLEIYRKNMAGLVAMIQEFQATTGGLVFVAGDFNVNYRGDVVKQASIFPYASLGAINVISSYQSVRVPDTGTHVLPSGFDKRLIDYVFTMTKRNVSTDDLQILFGLSSDHRPLVSDFTIYNNGCFRNHVNICFGQPPTPTPTPEPTPEPPAPPAG
jgi:endonuclease/exonuclease/phosphatase (EEP) superfamily protein YafD